MPKVGRIGRDVLAPFLKQGDYYSGLWNSAATTAEQIGFDVEGYAPSAFTGPTSELHRCTAQRGLAVRNLVAIRIRLTDLACFNSSNNLRSHLLPKPWRWRGRT